MSSKLQLSRHIYGGTYDGPLPPSPLVVYRNIKVQIKEQNGAHDRFFKKMTAKASVLKTVSGNISILSQHLIWGPGFEKEQTIGEWEIYVLVWGFYNTASAIKMQKVLH